MVHHTRDNSDYSMIPAALQSGSSTPVRLSCYDQENSSEQLTQQDCKTSYGGEYEGKCLVAFPRPRSSIDTDARKVSIKGSEEEKPPVDSRLERRRKNQYKRHGSLTLAWQQQVDASKTTCPSRLSSEVVDEHCSSTPVTTGVSPISTPVASVQRNFHTHARIIQATSASCSDIASTNISNCNGTDDKPKDIFCNTGGNTGILPSNRWRSGSFTAACVDRLPKGESIRHGFSGLLGSLSSDNRQRKQPAHESVASDDNVYCVPLSDASSGDDCNGSGKLFAPVNISRSSSRVSASSVEKCAEGSNTHRSLSSFIAYYTHDAEPDQANPADDISDLSQPMQTSCAVGSPRESGGNLPVGKSAKSTEKGSATSPKLEALAALCVSAPVSESASFRHCARADSTSDPNRSAFSQETAPHLVELNNTLEPADCKRSFPDPYYGQAAEPHSGSANGSLQCSYKTSITYSSSAPVLDIVNSDSTSAICSEHKDNCKDSTNNVVGDAPRWLAEVARHKTASQTEQAAEHQQATFPGCGCHEETATDSGTGVAKGKASALSPELVYSAEYSTDGRASSAPYVYVQSSRTSGASDSVGQTRRNQKEVRIHEGFGECGGGGSGNGANGGCDGCSKCRTPYSVNRMNGSDATALLNTTGAREAPALDTQSVDIDTAPSHCTTSISALSSSSTNSFVFVSGAGSHHSSARSSSDGALFFSSSHQKQNDLCSSEINKRNNPISTAAGSYIYLPPKSLCRLSTADSTSALPVATAGAAAETYCLEQKLAGVRAPDHPYHHSRSGSRQNPECFGPWSLSPVYSHVESYNSKSGGLFEDISDSRYSVRNKQHKRLLINPPSAPLPVLPPKMNLAQSASRHVSIPVSTSASASVSATEPTPVSVPTHILPTTRTDAFSAGHTTSSAAACASADVIHSGDGDNARVESSRPDLSEACLLTESPTNHVAQEQRKTQTLYELDVHSDKSHDGKHAGKSHDEEVHADQNSNRPLYDQHMQTVSGHEKAWDSEDKQQQLGGVTRHPTMVFDHSPIFCSGVPIGTTLNDTGLDGDGFYGDSHAKQPEYHSDSETKGSPSQQTLYDRESMCKPRRMRSMTESNLARISRFECRASEELAHEHGYNYISKSARLQPPRFSKSTSASSFNSSGAARRKTALEELLPTQMPIPRPHTAAAAEQMKGRDVADNVLGRNSLFSNAVRQQSRCMSVLLQQGSHGGIRRIGPLLITMERGGSAIKHLNPAFIDMMDVQPVDKGSVEFLQKSNIRRSSFSMPPSGPGGDWLDTLSDIIGASRNAKGTKQGADHVSSSGPGMWWPLNDDNCSDEVSYDVHIAPLDSSDPPRDKANGLGRHHGLERTGSSSTIASVAGQKPSSSRSSGRKGSVSSQLRLMGRPETPSGNGNGVRQHVSYNGFSVQHPPALTHSSSDASEPTIVSSGFGSRTPQSSSSANVHTHSFTNQLADVTMKTESGLITRSVKCVSLRVLVNRLASPEGNVDSDLLTDFLNSYRFFAHPLDVMRLIVVRYLNCFDNGDAGNDAEGSEVEEAGSTSESDCKYLTINGWRSKPNNANTASSGGPNAKAGSSNTNNDVTATTPNAAATKSSQSSAAPAADALSKKLPLLVRNDGAIIQLRVMNIIKYWIKFHPHDFRLHHRLTRLLLLFLSHIQKQPGRADFVNAIRQKLSSGRLLAVEMPAFVGPSARPTTAQTTIVPSKASSIRSSCMPTPTAESARSAIDLQLSGGKKSGPNAASVSAESHLRPERLAGSVYGVHDTAMPVQRETDGHGYQPNYQLYADAGGNGASLRHATDVGSGFPVPVPTSSSRPQTVKKSSTSYFRSLFQSRSSKNSSTNGSNMHEAAGNSVDAEAFGGYNSGSVRISQRSDNHSITPNAADLAASGDGDEHGLRIPNGNMYASDFGLLVMEALAKSGVPTPQTPVGRTLLNYTIANRNPYRINLVGIDPATFAEQLTLLEHELFSRISATEFSLKGRVGNLETILHTMQGAVTADSHNSASALAGVPQTQQGQVSASNPVPNLTAMTSWFNQATYWTVLSVLSEPTSAARALVVKQLIHVALHCLARRNYYGAFEIVIALDNSAVRRLHETWALVPELMKDIVAQILEVLQSRMNFRTYRESLKAALTGASGPDEEIFSLIAEQLKIARAKDLVAMSTAYAHPNMSGGSSFNSSSNGHSLSSSGSGFGHFVHGAFFGGSNGDDGKSHSRKKSNAPSSVSVAKNTGPLLTEQDCVCITYAIHIRAASFMYFDPSATNPGDGAVNKHGSSGSSIGSHGSVPAYSSSKGGRGSAGHMSSGSTKSGSSAFTGSTVVSISSTGKSTAESIEPSDSRNRRARSTSNGSSGMFSSKGSMGSKQGQMAANGVPLPLVPFIAVHMTDLFHADQANASYSEEYQKMRSRNPTGPEGSANSQFMPQLPSDRPSSRRQVRCDSAAISNVNQAQSLLNMQKFRLITTMFRELHLAQRTKYPYAADVTLQQQIHSAVRNLKAQVNDIYSVIEDIVTDDPTLIRPATSYSSPFARTRTDSSASRTPSEGISESIDQAPYGYPLYQIPSLQKSQTPTSFFDTSIDWDFADLKDNQELEQRLFMLSKWIEPSTSLKR